MSWLTRLKHALYPRRLDEELAEEIRNHLERRAEQLRQSGLSAAEADRQAAIAFGNAGVIRERSREVRLWAALEGTGQDLRFAWRGLRRNPALAATMIVSLSLAIGANTAIYSIADAGLLRPLPVPEPDRLFTLTEAGGGDIFSYPLFAELSRAAGDAGRLMLFDAPNRVEVQEQGADSPYEEAMQQMVSPDAFEALRVPPALGRLFSSQEDHYPGPRAAAVLSHDYWQRRFGGDPGVVGRTLRVNNRPFTIIGVAVRGFTGAEPGKFIDLWLPVTMTDPDIFTNPGARLFHVMGRLSPGVALGQLQARLRPAFRRHEEARGSEADAMLLAEPGASGVATFQRSFARPLWALLGLSVVILLLACANVTSLLLARSHARAAEFALRVSLGARRTRLVRQQLTESLLVSAAAGVCGWALASLAAPGLLAIVSTTANPVRLDLSLDLRVFLFCAAAGAATALLAGLAPALHGTASGPVGRMRLGRVFVGVQVAFAFCLVSGGAGFLYSLRNLAAVDTGFDPTGVTVLSMTADVPQHARQRVLMQEVRRRVAGMPNVQGAAAGWMAVFSGARRAQRVGLPGGPLAETQETFYRVSPDYFATMRTPLVSGRDLTEQDNDDEPVASVVNRAFARRYFGSDAVLGREFLRDDGVRHQVVGVAADSRFGSLRGGPEPIVYMPMKPPRAFTLYVRSTMDAATVAKMAGREAAAMGLGLRVREVTTLGALVGNTLVRERLLASIGGAIALLGLVLAGVGLFGILNYSVTRRTKEIGIRVALGAPPLPIYGLVLRDLARMTAGGLVAGVAGSVGIARLTHSLVFGVKPVDPVVLATSVGVLAAVAMLAGGLPARRAAAVDPVVALRRE